jgi:glycosyltransferase involved in cell wall biosynthesis
VQLKVSVILPVYNSVQTVGAAIESILSQTYRCTELVIINDGSTDGTKEVVDRFGALANVTIVHRENHGLIDTLNYALTICGGDYISRMDADDIADKERIERQVAFMQAHDDVVCCGTAIEYFGDKTGIKMMPVTHRACVDTLLLGSCFAHPTVMIRAAVIRKHGIRYDKSALHAEDYALWCELARFGKLANLDYVGLKYRVHGSQISKAKRAEQIKTHISIVRRFRTQMGLAEISSAKLENFLFGSDVRSSGRVSAGLSALGALCQLNRPWRGLDSFICTLKVFAARHIAAVYD